MARRILIGITAFIALAAGVLLLPRTVFGAGLDRYLAQLQAAGAPLTFADINAMRDPVPTGKSTVAEILARAATMIATTDDPPPRALLGTDGNRAIDLDGHIPPQAVESTRAYLAAHHAVLSTVHTIPHLPPGRFDIDYTGPANEVMTRFLATCSPLRPILECLYLDAVLQRIDGNQDAAAANVPIMLDVVAPLAQEPALLAHLLRSAAATKSVALLEEVLQAGPLEKPTLHALDRALAAFLDQFSMQWALRGERALFIAGLDASHPGASSRTAGRRGPMARIFSLAQYGDLQQGTAMLGWLIDAGNDSANLRAANQRIGQYLASPPPAYVFTQMNMKSVSRAVVLHLRTLAQLRAAHVALAVERYRLDRSQLPDGLDALVPVYLAALPKDPFIDGPLRAAQTTNGLAIYSVGDDGTDDGGSVRLRADEQRPRDVGMYLRE